MHTLQIIIRKIILAILVVSFSVSNFFAQEIVTKDEYAVYARVLREIYNDELEKRKEYNYKQKKIEFVILNQTYVFEKAQLQENPDATPIEFDAKTLREFRKYSAILKNTGVEENFDLRSAISVNLQKLFPVTYQYSLVSKAEINNLLEIGRRDFDREEKEFFLGKKDKVYEGSGLIWKPFYKQYPNANGYYQFSRIGFSRNRKWALVFVEWESGECSSSLTYLLMKIKGKWQRHSISGGRGYS